VLPAFANATRNSQLAAVVSGDRTKRRETAKRYGIERTFTYDKYDECLQDVDAVYLELPNFMHAEYTVRAAGAGAHVLSEKPMAVTVDEGGGTRTPTVLLPPAPQDDASLA
jgi:predicted dehydrogenase